MLFFPYIVEEVNTNRHQCKRSSKIFIIGKQTMIEMSICLNSPCYFYSTAIVIGTVVLFLLLALLIALVVYIFEIPHLNNKSTQQVYKKENISLVKLFDVDPSELNKWSVTVMDETVADYSVNVYSVKCSELTTKSREIKRRVIDKYYPAPILPNNGIIIGTFLYLLPGSYLNYTFSIKTNSTTDEGVIGTLLEYADLDYNKDNVTPEKKTMVYANTTLSVSIKKARYLLSVLEVTTQGDFTLSYEWNAFQLYWNETQYNPPYCTLESPDTATCSKKLHKMGEKQCVLAFTSRSRGPDSPLELSIFISSSNIDIVIALSCIAVAIFVCTCAVVIACIVSCCCKHICKRYYS